MERFHRIDDAEAIVRAKGGVFRQVRVFRRGDTIFAGHGTGFIRLQPGGGTSNPDVSWVDIELPAGMTHRAEQFDLIVTDTTNVRRIAK